MTSTDLAQLKKALWPPDAARPVTLYGVLDGARSPRVYESLERSYRTKSCLFAGTLHPSLERAAPHLLELFEKDSVTDHILHTGWHDAWGILLDSNAPMHRIRRHLRTLLRVKDEGGRFLLFRFYDPRILSAYLPTCTAAELQLLFGSSINRFITSSEDGAICLIYSLRDDKLDIEQVERSAQPSHATAETVGL